MIVVSIRLSIAAHRFADGSFENFQTYNLHRYNTKAIHDQNDKHTNKQLIA